MLSVGLIVFAAELPGAGQEPPVFELPEVIVPGKRPQPQASSPAAVTVLTRQDLQQLGVLTLGDALQFVAETYVRIAGSGPGGLAQPSIRGSTPQQVLVLIDGVPLNATAQFGVNLNTITLADVDRVEVLRGPYSAIYGSSALGGVINVITRTDVGPSVAARTGSNATTQVELRLGGSGSSMYSAGLQYLGTGGDRSNSDATRWTGVGRLAIEPDTGPRLVATFYRSAGDSGLPGSTFFPTLQDRLTDGRTILSLAWTREQARPSRDQARVWWLADDLHFRSPSSTSDSDGSAWGLEWQSVTQRGPGAVLTWGAEWQEAKFQLNSVSAFGTSGFQAEASTAAAYVQYDNLLNQRTFVGIGVRYDFHSVYGEQLNPRAGLVYFLAPTLRLRASIGRTFRGPTFGELFFPRCSNPNLKPERAWAADAGLEWIVRPLLQLRLNAFYTDATDLIVGGCNPQNVGSARLMGLSTELVGQLAERWSVMSNLTWTDGIDRTTGQPLLRLPNIQANVVLRYDAGEQRALSILTNYVSDRIDLNFSTFPATRVTVPGYVTASVRYEQPLGTLRLRVGLDNLFDTRFETLSGFPGPGRTVFMQVTGDF
jgi:outer membrane cobalamin receptor